MKKTNIATLSLLFVTHFSWAIPEVLQIVQNRAAQTKASGKVPVVVMDLDETVVDSTPRKFRAYQEAVNPLCGPKRSGSCGRVAGINLTEVYALPNHYNWNPLWAALGGLPHDFQTNLEKQALDYYLSNQFMDLDQAVPGATEFVQNLRSLGTHVFFVSSRWVSKQNEGTMHSIEHLGLATAADHDAVILRPDGRSGRPTHF